MKKVTIFLFLMVFSFSISAGAKEILTSDKAIKDLFTGKNNISLPLPPPCPEPNNVRITVDSTSITLHYNTVGDSVEYEWGLTGYEQGTGTDGESGPQSWVLDGLETNTTYDIYIRSDCSSTNDGTSPFTGPFTITTHCGFIHSPFVEDFSSSEDNNLAACWNKYTNYTLSYPKVESSTGILVLDNQYMNPDDTIMAISPAIWQLGDEDRQIKFTAHSSTSDHAFLEIGTVSSLNNPGSFSMIRTVQLTGSPREYFIDLDGTSAYNGVDVYIVLRHANTVEAQTINVDDFEVRPIPDCQPTNLFDISAAANGTSVSLNWKPGRGDKWELEYGPQGYTSGSETEKITVADTFYTFTGLDGDTHYDFYLKDSCSNGIYGPLVGPVEMLTSCGAPDTAMTLPFTEGFESYSGSIAMDSNMCYGDHSLEFRSSTGFGRLRFNAGSGFYGTGSAAATLDRNPPGESNTNFMTFTFNLSDYMNSAGVIFGFDFRNHGQTVAEENDRVWLRGSFGDEWIEIYNLNENQATAGALKSVRNINLTLILRDAGQSLSSSTQIRFGQVGGIFALGPTYVNGYTFDNISLEAPECPYPTDIKIIPGDVSAFVSYTTDNDSVDYAWSLYIHPDSAETASAGGGSFTIKNLLPDTTYYLRVKSTCASSDSAGYLLPPFELVTQCSPEYAPYTSNFDSYKPGIGETYTPGCWSLIGRSISGEPNGYIELDTNFHNSYPGALRLNNGNDYLNMIVAPRFPDLTAGDKRIEFYSRGRASSYKLAIGTMSEFGNPETFHPLDTLDVIPAYQRYIFDFTTANGYNGQDEYIVFSLLKEFSSSDIFIDDFHYDFMPSCIEASDLTYSNLDSTSVDLNWVSGGSSTDPDFQLEYGFAGLGGNDRVIVESNSTTLTDLLPNADYCTWVREICTPGDTSGLWTEGVCFTTPCSPVKAPYINDFENENLNETPVCWEALNKDPRNPRAQYSTAEVSYPGYNSDYKLNLYNGNSPAIQVMAISPYFSDMTDGDKRVSFYAQGSGPILVVGTMPSTEDINDFHPLDTLTLLSSTYSKYVVNIDEANGYNGTDHYVALFSITTDNYQTIGVDDFIYDYIQPCERPFDINYRAITDTSIEVSWSQGNDGATDWIVEYGPQGFEEGEGTRLAVTDDTTTITGLQASTDYCVRIAELCPGGTDTSFFSPAVCFKTNCPPSALPFFENFNNSFGCFRVESRSEWDNVEEYEESSLNGTAFAIGGYNHGLRPDVMESSVIDAGSVTTPILLEFDYHFLTYEPFREILNDSASVLVYDGTQWQEVFTIQDTVKGSFDNPKHISIDISAHANANMKLRFEYTNHDRINNFWAVDNISVSTCSPPSGFRMRKADGSNAVLEWTETSAGSYTVEYGRGNFSLGEGTQVPIGRDSLVINNILQNNLAYHAYLRSDCGPGFESEWVGPVSVFKEPDLCDDMEVYNTGAVAGQSALFKGWTTNEGGDARITDSRANSGSKSIHLTSTGTESSSNIVALFDPVNSGIQNIEFSVFVPVDSSAYYNVQQRYSINPLNNRVAFEVYLKDNGTGRVQYESGSSTRVVGTFSYNPGQWDTISHVVDLDNDTTWMVVNGSEVNVGWDYSAANPSLNPDFEGINFRTLADPAESPGFYIDNFCVKPYVPPGGCATPTLAMASDVSCESVNLSWNSGNTGSSSIVEYGPQGFATGMGTTLTASSPVVINDLDPGMTYEFYVYDICGIDTSAMTNSVSITTKSLANAVINVDSVYAPGLTSREVDFNASASSGANTFRWNFGDGDSATGVAATHNYTTDGIYTVRLIVSGDCGADTTTETVNISGIGICEEPADLSVSDTTCTSVTITWSSVNAGSVIEYGTSGFTPGSGTVLSNVNSPQVLSNLMPGASYEFYIVDTCTMGKRSDTTSRMSFVTESGPLAADFTYTVVSQTAATVDIDFDASGSVGADVYNWTFGDGDNGVGDSARHTYTAGRTYTVTLTVSGDCGTDTYTQVIDYTSIGENVIDQSLEVFPNPARDQIHVSFETQSSEGIVLKVMDLSGKTLIVKKEKDINGRFEGDIKIENLASGTYLVEVQSGDIRVQRRIVKQ